MDDWKPKPNVKFDLHGLKLDPQQGFVLSRIDGATSFRELVLLTGMSGEAMHEALSVLMQSGAVLSDDCPQEFSMEEDAYALLNTLDEQFPVDDLSGESTALDVEAIAGSEAVSDLGDEVSGATVSEKAENRSEDIEPKVIALEAGAANEDSGMLDAVEDSETARWSGVYRDQWKGLPVAERIEAARSASSDELHTFCFDQNAKVLRAILDNAQVGLSHARLLAAHHVNGAGLDALAKKTHFLRDGQVQRAIMRNAQLSDALLTRILQPKALSEVHRIAFSRDVTERVRQQARKAFRTKFTRASAEEKVNLIIRSEGRCLTGLVGVALDGKSAALLSQRPIQSTLLVQNLVRWPSTPPPVLVHLSKQPVVLRSPPLKNSVLRHPNASAQVKRQLQ